MDNFLRARAEHSAVWISRVSLFVIYFWFGILKVIALSPASGVVTRLGEATIPFIQMDMFLIWFGIFECLIGILFLFPGRELVAFPLLLLHLITTSGPMVFLPQETWQRFLVPTLEGQYIIKNLLIFSAGTVVFGFRRGRDAIVDT